MIGPSQAVLSRRYWIERGILLLGIGVSFGVPLLRKSLSDEVGEQVHFAYAILAATLVLVTGLGLGLLRLHWRVKDLEESHEDLRFGTGARRDREAVDILVKALRAPDGRARETALRTLKKISGLDLGGDAKIWEEWWAAARPTFVRAGSPAPDKAPQGKP